MKPAAAWMIAAAFAFVLAGAAPAQTPEPTEPAAPAPIKHLEKCPDNVGDYMDSDATAPFVKKCLGRPASENHNPDGRFVYMYSLQGGNLMLAFLFAADKSLIRVSAYAKN